MEQVKIAHAKTHFSALLHRVETGEEIVIARRGKAVARLVPEVGNTKTAAQALRAAWALGGFDLPPRAPLSAADDVPLD